MRRVLLSLSLVASVCAVPGAAANTSHAGRPQIDGDLIMHKHAHFGYGSITCHSPGTIVFLSRRSRPGYQLHGCRHISYQTLGS
jgi:hypothetical protein